MKKLFLLLCFGVSLNLAAESIIPSEFFGCKLGQSTRVDVLQKMSMQGAKVENYSESAIIFSGVPEGTLVSNVSCMTFVEDTLTATMFFVKRNEDSMGKIETLKQKYGVLLPTLKDNAFLSMYQDSLIAQFNVDSASIWSRVDDVYSIAIVEDDSTYCVVYLASNYMLGRFVALMSEHLTMNPHYDEANRVKSVAGCEFGDSRKNVMEKFRPRAANFLSEDAQSVTYSDIKIGGQYFKLGNLYFINGKFISCKFETNFNTWRKDEAIATYKSLCSTYDNKYTNAIHVDDDSENMNSYYGMVQSDYEDAKIPPIIITMAKGVSRGGDTYYYVTVSYFALRLQHLYDDEI